MSSLCCPLTYSHDCVWYNGQLSFFTPDNLIPRSISCSKNLSMRRRHGLKSKTEVLHLPVLITKKPSALRRRTTLSTRLFIYHISVSGKLSLYLYTNRHKAENQQGFPAALPPPMLFFPFLLFQFKLPLFLCFPLFPAQNPAFSFQLLLL